MLKTLTKCELGKVFALKGRTPVTAPLLISLAVKFQQYSKVLLIDADHVFNKTFLDKHYHKDVNLNLKKILVARPYTSTELADLLQNLQSVLARTSAKSVVITGFDRYLSGDQLSAMLDSLEFTTKKFNIFTLISCSKNIPLEKISVCCRV